MLANKYMHTNDELVQDETMSPAHVRIVQEGKYHGPGPGSQPCEQFPKYPGMHGIFTESHIPLDFKLRGALRGARKRDHLYRNLLGVRLNGDRY